MGDRAPDRLSRWEILGAWLRLWTPPREAVVPPVPRRKVAVGGAFVLAAAAVAVVVLLNTESDRDAAEQRAARAAVQRHAEFLADVERRQAPQHGRGQGDAASERTRRALLAAAKTDISAGVDDRDVDCEPFRRRSTRRRPRPTSRARRRLRLRRDRVAVRDRRDRHAVPARRALRQRPLRVVRDRPARRPRPAQPPLPDACRLERQVEQREQREREHGGAGDVDRPRAHDVEQRRRAPASRAGTCSCRP